MAKGINTSINDNATSSMVLQFIKGLTGEINIANENGTKITICFSPDPLNEFDTNSIGAHGRLNS